MSETITQDRSPRSPGLTLEDTINLTSKLFDAIRTASVGPDIAVKPLGYGGTNGAAMGTLATLAQYGLVDRTGGKVAVTPLAVRILHPKGDDQREAAIREAALYPKVMKELYDGYLECAEGVITGHLIQSGFNADRAKKVASIHVANKTFAKLSAQATPPHIDEDTGGTNDRKESDLTSGGSSIQSNQQSVQPIIKTPVTTENRKVLAQYSIPLGPNEATLTFVGERLSPDDFDALVEYVGMFKKQLQRKLKAESSPPETFPFAALWKNKDSDKPVTIVGVMGDKDGKKYYQSEDGTGIPASELFPSK